MKFDLLIICLDQLSALALGQGASPTIDALSARGSSFATAITPYPLCIPSRASFWSGLLPHRTGVEGNGGPQHPILPWPAGRMRPAYATIPSRNSRRRRQGENPTAGGTHPSHRKRIPPARREE